MVAADGHALTRYPSSSMTCCTWREAAVAGAGFLPTSPLEDRVYSFCIWRDQGVWKRVHASLRQSIRLLDVREPTPGLPFLHIPRGPYCIRLLDGREPTSSVGILDSGGWWSGSLVGLSAIGGCRRIRSITSRVVRRGSISHDPSPVALSFSRQEQGR